MNERGLVVVAAEACGTRRNNIVFRVGTLEKSKSNIMWKEIDHTAAENMRGCSPVVAINSARKNNNIISVHMSNSFRKLFVVYGFINADTKKIEWSEQGKPLEYETGLYPAVTLNSRGQVVRMHEQNGRYGMYYATEVGNLS